MHAFEPHLQGSEFGVLPPLSAHCAVGADPDDPELEPELEPELDPELEPELEEPEHEYPADCEQVKPVEAVHAFGPHLHADGLTPLTHCAFGLLPPDPDDPELEPDEPELEHL